MHLDLQRYSHHLASFDMTDAEKALLSQQLWMIAMSAVDRAWNDAPEQILMGTNGTKCPARAHDRLDSVAPLTSTFNDAAQEGAARKTQS